MKLDLKEIVKACNGEVLQGDINIEVEKFSIDTRNLEQGSIYIAIKGETTDGHNYINKAFENGAIGVIVEEITEEYSKEKIIIKVKNTLKALQDIAKYKRKLFNIPVVAVTGSVGKTSTKDMIASVLSEKFNVLKTEGNYNNHLGVPLTLLRLEKEHTAAVIEMGMNHKGEISVLTNIAKPTIATITNIGTAHIGLLGSRENILKAKLEIIEGLAENGKIIINNDNDMLNNWHLENNLKNVITYGIDNESNFSAYNIESYADKSIFKIEDQIAQVPVAGKHFVYNSLCAYAIGKSLGIDEKSIIKGIKNLNITSKRMQIQENKKLGITILNDCYNASYDSMKASLEVLKNIGNTRKIAVLGDMLELGEFSEELHRKVGEEVAKNKIDVLIAIGDLSIDIYNAAKGLGVQEVFKCKNNEEGIELIKKILKKEDTILFKASNRMNFEEIINKIS